MEKIASFKVDHLILKEGLYVSRIDRKGDSVATTYDIRLKRPNKGEFTPSAAHTIEHLGATWLRNSKWKDEVIYFGPMGCLTGFYVILWGEPDLGVINEIIYNMCQFIISYDLPTVIGATPEECGNYRLHDLDSAKREIKEFVEKIYAN